MKCSGIREALSALADGEESGVPQPLLVRHLAGCPGCTSFRDTLGLLDESLGTARFEPAPDLSEIVVDASRRELERHPARLALRGALALTALVELGFSLPVLISHHAYRLADHADHESVSFALAIAVSFLAAVVRPRLASAYLPVVGVAVTLLMTTALVDVRAHRVAAGSELPHLDLLVGFVVLCLLAHRPSRTRPPRTRRVPRPSPQPVGVRPGRLRVIRRLAVVPVVAAAAMLTAASPASAHAILEQSTPGEGATVQAAPTDVTLRFDEAVTTLPGAVRVYAPNGSRVDNGDVSHPGGDGARVGVGLQHLSRAGTYLVSWRVVSADSHPVSGAFTFSLRSSSKAAAVATTQNNDEVAAVLGAARWLSYLGSALLVGGAAFLMLCWSAGWGVARARRLVWAGLGVSAVAAVLGVLLKGPYDAGLGLGTVGQGPLVSEVLGTTYGHGFVARLVILAIAAVWLLLRERLRTASRIGLAAVLGLGFAATYAVTGHAVAGTQRPLALAADTIHVVSMSLWLGGLVMLLAVVLPRRDAAEAGAALVRFSRVAMTCVLLLVATGTYQAWRQVGAWAAFPHTTYGRELLVKLGIVAVVIAVASGSRAWVRRTMRPPLEVQAATVTAPSPTEQPVPDLRVVRRNIVIEATLMVVILGITSALVATEPGRTAYHPTVAANLHLGPDLVQVSGVPNGDRRMSLHLYLFDAKSQPTDPAQVTATVSLPSKEIGPLPVTLQNAGTGHRIGQVTVPVAGDWQLQVTVRTTDIDEYTKTVRLPLH